jgi:small conductance mechanosensitive channel
VHFISHGNIEAATNLTRGAAAISLSVAVAYSEDLDRVFELINSVGQEFAMDAALARYVRQPPYAAGIEKLGEASIEIRVEALTAPGEQLRIASELRRRLKATFDTEGIRIRDEAAKP